MKTNKHILFILAALLVLVSDCAYAQRMPEAFAQGKQFYRQRKYQEATVSFYKVLSELSTMKNKTSAIVDSEKITLDYLNLCYSESREMNIPFENLDFDTTVTEEYFFTIKEVLSLEHDSAIVTINEGKQDGIYWGAESYVEASYASGVNDTARNLKFLGSARIIDLSDYSCKVVVRFFKKYKGFKIYPKDMLDVYVHPISGSKKGLLYELNRLNIIFNSNAKEEILNKRGFFYNTDPNLEAAVMDVYSKQITDFATDLDEYKDERFDIKYKDGPFKGITMKKAFHITTPYDIFAFFNFAKSYPGKYMATPWAVNETYATWILNDCPMGERDRDWIVPVIEATSMGNLATLVKKITYYINNDTLSAWDGKVIDYINAGKKDAAMDLCNKLIYISEYMEDDLNIATFYIRRAYMKKADNDDKGALKDMLIAYNLFPTSDNYAYGLASMYGGVEQFDSCFYLYDKLLKKYPDNYDIRGQYGWYKTLAGKFEEAKLLCGRAYRESPGNYNYTVNYGHTFLLTGNMDSAKYYYNQMLEKLEKPEEYTEGPKKDFEIFFRKGWRRIVVADIAEWLDTEFRKKYSFITASNVVWTDAKKYYDEKKYTKSVAKYQEYINTLNQTADPDQRYIHTATVYIGWCYEAMKQTDSAIKYYSLALQIATQKLDTIRAKDPEDDYRVKDYKRLYNYYNDEIGNKHIADAYKVMYNAETQKLTERNTTSHIHIICIGGNDTISGSAYEANAKLFYENIITIENAHDSAGSRIFLSGSSLTKKILVEKIQDIRKISMPEDIFIIYYSGHTTTVDDKEVLYFNLKDTANGKIDAKELLQDIHLIYAKKKMIITDDPEPQLLAMISAQYTASSNYANEIIFLCPALKTPTQEDGHTIFTTELVNSLTELKKKEQFSAKEFVDKASFALGRGEHYLPVLSFSYGRDFILYKNDSVKAAEVTLSRGLNIGTNFDNDNAPDQASSGSQKNYALFFASNEYDDKNTWHPLSNPISDASTLGKLLQEDFGFQVEVVRNASKKEMQDKLKAYRSKNYGPNDQLMIFFAGHGVYHTDANMGYIVAKDSKNPRNEDPDFDTYFSYGDLGNLYLKNIKCRRIFLVLDACYAGSFFEEKGYHRGANEAFANDKDALQRLGRLKKNASGKTYYKGVSSGGKETVEDGKKDQHSPFAAGLIQMLNNAIANQYITADAIIGDIQNYHPGNTTPSSGTFNYSDPQGLFIFEVKSVDQKEATKQDHLKR